MVVGSADGDFDGVVLLIMCWDLHGGSNRYELTISVLRL